MKSPDHFFPDDSDDAVDPNDPAVLRRRIAELEQERAAYLDMLRERHARERRDGDDD